MTLKIPVAGLRGDDVHVDVDGGKIHVTGDAIVEDVALPPGTESSQVSVVVANGMVTINIAAPVKHSIPIGGGQ